MDYTTIRSKRKSISIEITQDGKIVVRAPMHATDKMIRTIVDKKQVWIQKHLASVLSRPAESELTSEQINAYISAAKAILPEKVKYYADIMGVCQTDQDVYLFLQTFC